MKRELDPAAIAEDVQASVEAAFLEEHATEVRRRVKRDTASAVAGVQSFATMMIRFDLPDVEITRLRRELEAQYASEKGMIPPRDPALETEEGRCRAFYEHWVRHGGETFKWEHMSLAQLQREISTRSAAKREAGRKRGARMRRKK